MFAIVIKKLMFSKELCIPEMIDSIRLLSIEEIILERQIRIHNQILT